MPDPSHTLNALSPLDGRYYAKTAPLRAIFSEYGLIRQRVFIEIEWLIHLSAQATIHEIPTLSPTNVQHLRAIVTNFALPQAEQVKAIEHATQHDVKAVEYFVKRAVQGNAALEAVSEFIHFACTSEDINNLAYGLMLKQARETVLIPAIQRLITQITTQARAFAEQPMLARTHGQPASPTTLGKEFANYAARLTQAQQSLAAVSLMGKFNGAVGNFNAHYIAYPELPWPTIAAEFVHGLGLSYQPLTTQIEPHDYIATLCHSLIRVNSVVLDFDRDLWSYIALGYFQQRVTDGEIGSSTMPHKVNPIDFENSEGNLGLANALLGHLAEKLPLSRWQRDLSDSTVLRNLGTAAAHTLIALEATTRGLTRLTVNAIALQHELAQHWQVLTEAVQTVMRRYGLAQPYEQLKTLTRGKDLDRESLHAFIDSLAIPAEAKTRLLALTPATYIGNAASAARMVGNPSS